MENTTSTQLKTKILATISKKENQRLTFYEFMKMALYEPELGYYTKDKTKIGKNADFYTSSSVGPIFGQTIANSFIEILPYTTDHQSYMILEIGGGNGRFARDVLNFLKESQPSIYDKLQYYMLEVSPYHKKLQYDNVKEHVDHFIWVQTLEEIPRPFEGIVFSNELLDSFPVHKVKKIDGEIKEVYVTWNEKEESFEELTDKISDSRLVEYFEEQGVSIKEGQTAEINLDAIEWVNNISQLLDKGYILTIDYGYPADELYASHRHEGSLMCYYQHVANDDPYKNIGDQDITCHVNFTAIMYYGERLGLENVWFTTQSKFLMNNGILNYLSEIDFKEIEKKDIFVDKALKVNRAIRHLITPGEMGDTFKVLLQQKNIKKKNYRFLENIWEQMGISSF